MCRSGLGEREGDGRLPSNPRSGPNSPHQKPDDQIPDDQMIRSQIIRCRGKCPPSTPLPYLPLSLERLVPLDAHPSQIHMMPPLTYTLHTNPSSPPPPHSTPHHTPHTTHHTTPHHTTPHHTHTHTHTHVLSLLHTTPGSLWRSSRGCGSTRWSSITSNAVASL